jgi:acyl carrier protein
MSECNELQKQVAALFAEHLELEVPSVQTDLIDAGILDSLKFVDLLMQLEQKFEARIDLNTLELDNFRSIQKIADFLARRPK